MAMAEPLAATLRNALKTLCCEDGWSYAIFWRFNPRNSLLLTVEDAYYDDQLGEEIANMLPQIHFLREGIVGQVAFTGKHRWVHSDGQTEELNLTGLHICEDDSGLRQQFYSGIKTIAVVSVKPWGVVQFGSKKKILERDEFLEQTQRLLMGIEDEGMPSASTNTVLSLDCENYDLNGLWASISSENSYDWNLKSVHGDHSEGLLGKTYSSASPDDSFDLIYKILEEEDMTPMHDYSSCLGDQLTHATESQVVLSEMDSTDVLLKPNSSMNNLTASNPCFGTLNGEVSSLNSLWQPLVPGIRAQDVADIPCKEANAFSCDEVAVQDLELTSLYGMTRLLETRGTFQEQIGNSLDNQHSAQSGVVTEVNFPDSSSTAVLGFSNNLNPVETIEEFPKFFAMDNLFQRLSPSPEDSFYGTVTALDNSLFDHSQDSSPPTSFGLVGSSAFGDIPFTCPSVHNSITATVNLSRQETSVAMHSSENSLLDSLGLDLSCDQADDWWDRMLKLAAPATAATDAGFSDCISDLNVSTLKGTGKRLFSELGLEELLNGESSSNSLNISNFEDQLSTNKKKRTEYSPVNRNKKQLANLALSGEARAELVQPVSESNRANNLAHKKEIFPKLQEGLWIDDRRSNTGRAVPTFTQKPVEPNKVTRKRARPGESNRPRPKDRQLIQDRIKELRGIIPNVGKCSIDCLLELTIRYMQFLQSITKYAGQLQEPSEPKLIQQANGVVLKESSVKDSKNGGGGATWAFEVAGQRLVCPIIVEDMDPPGRMLIEMLCEEQGSFLEIVDAIRGFGLNILKGKMEMRENKIWARFIVEANRHVTRIDVFWSLIHLLQQTNTTGRDSTNKNCSVIDAGVSSVDHYEKTDMPVLPMVMADTIR